MGLCGGTGLSLAAAGSPAAPLGNWLTADHQAVITLAPCGANLCGHIAGMVLAPTAPAPTDWRGQTQCGEVIVKMSPHGTEWRGTITDPRKGSTYHATLARAAGGDLDLHGYVIVPLLGQTQVWTPYTGPLPADCRLAPP